MQGDKVKSGDQPLLSDMYPDLRKGKWTREEEEYANKLISYFNSGMIRVQPGLTLRAYLSDKLHCDPMRITKKYTGSDCIGKQVFLVSRHDDKTVKKCETELKKLRNVFIARLVSKNKERLRSNNKRKTCVSQERDGGEDSTSTLSSTTPASAAPAVASSSSTISSSAAPPLRSSLSKADLSLLTMPHTNMTPATFYADAGLAGYKGGRGGKGEGSYKRVSSAPDLLSLQHVEGERQEQAFFAEEEGHLRKKRRQGGDAAIPRSRSMLSFDSFAEMDDRAAETLRSNFVALQKKAMNLEVNAGSEGDSNKLKISPRLNALPAFFSSEATSSEAAKYHKKSNSNNISSRIKPLSVEANPASQSAKFLQSLLLPPTGESAASLFPHMGFSSAMNYNNNDFSVLEERIPFSTNDNSNRTSANSSMFDDGGDGSNGNMFDLMSAVEMNSGGSFESKTDDRSLSTVDMLKSDTGTDNVGCISFDDHGFDEPEFFIGSGADIE